ncbi:protein FAR1-RELATED SEQUENCE 5-like [Lotus japonicus]|uniref:protein FAR1-RELATED SEQUENCE 5-like n=1 Tax=Lotus japonicus TaxID=34305 RepID=UPI00258D68D7|nr:protein FAR1-RELATED SEQUENCE 5-like [Lotus japonicus]
MGCLIWEHFVNFTVRQGPEHVGRVVVEGVEGDVHVSVSVGEEQGSDEEQESDEAQGTDSDEEEDENESKNVVEEQNVDVEPPTEIAINGIEDLGMVNFKQLSVNDIVTYHFPDREVAFLFYSWYARMHGFAARKAKVLKNNHGDVIQQRFVCFREGKRKEKEEPEVDVHAGEKRKRFPKKATRCECKAYCQVHVHKDNKRWHVRSVCDDHNHVLVEENLIGLVPTHRRMNEADITQLNCFRKSGITTPQAYGVFANQMGGYQNVPFGPRQMYNEKFKKKKVEVCDARGVITFLRNLKEKDPDLMWKHTSNEEGRLDKLSWSDGFSRDNYLLFGDVLAFDATYKKNKYKRPLVIFSGVNHHNQTIIFAAALVSNEKEETYVWLLHNLLDAMRGKAPVSVITDGDPAMKNAIKSVFPNAHHRLCAWHLLRNAVSNVAEPKFVQMFSRCMLWDLEIVEFEERWAQMVIECGCEENVWVHDLYERKKMWAAAYMRGEFFAGFRTTSRVEGLHAQVGKFVDSWNNLTDFMHNFFRYMSYQRQRELEADFASMHGDHVPQIQLKRLEKSASNHYTNNIFRLVSKGLHRCLMLKVSLFKETSTCIICFVSRFSLSSRKWNVTLSKTTSEFKCSCMRMESYGIPCDHILAVCRYLDLPEIPSSLIVGRWTKDAKEGLELRGEQLGAWDPMDFCRFTVLRENCRRMSKAACRAPETFRDTNELVLKQARKLEKLEKGDGVKQTVHVDHNPNDAEQFLRDPLKPIKRRIGGASRGSGPGRRTSHCGLCGGAGHNRKTCLRATQ